MEALIIGAFATAIAQFAKKYSVNPKLAAAISAVVGAFAIQLVTMFSSGAEFSVASVLAAGATAWGVAIGYYEVLVKKIV